MYAFSIDDDCDSSVDSLSDESLSNTFAPMEATGAFRSLFYFFREDTHCYSHWSPILAGTDDRNGTFTSDDPGTQGIPRSLADLCEMDADSSIDNNVYHKIVRSLAPLCELEPSPENFSVFFAFLGRTWPRFRPLIYCKDPRGLLLFSYWLALLHQVDQWWLRTKVRNLFHRIIAFLWKINDARIHALLPSISTATRHRAFPKASPQDTI